MTFHQAMLKKAEVRVFQGNSRGDNMILTIEKRMSLVGDKDYRIEVLVSVFFYDTF